MSEDAATLTTEQAAEKIVDIIEGRDGQMAIDMTLASDRDMAYNLNTIIEFRLRTLLGACPPPSDVRNRHEAYGIAAENFCQVNASVKKIRGDMNLLLTTLGDPNRPALEAVGSLLNSATLAALDVITMAAEMKRAMTDLPARYAAAARRTINRQCYEILMKNPKIYDDKALFGADHKNLLKTGTGITKEAVQAMIMAISTQEDQFKQAITIRPAMLVLPVGMGFDLFTLFNSPTIQTTDNTQAVNPLYRYGLQQVEDPEINRLAKDGAAPWFLLGNTEDTAFIEVDYLNGQEVPNIRRSETVGQLGFVWDIYLDWGIQVMDYRGAVKNPGIKIENTLLA